MGHTPSPHGSSPPGRKGTYKAVWWCGESAMGLPSFQEHLLGVSGRIHRCSLVSLSPEGPCFRSPFAERVPERWGHPATPASAWNVSEDMFHSIRGMGKGSHRFRPLPNTAEEPALMWLGPGTAACPPALSGCRAPHIQGLSKNRHKSTGTKCSDKFGGFSEG